MGVIRGLKGINNYFDEQERKSNASQDFVKTNWFKLAPGESVRVRFLQELDPDSENYVESAGLGIIAIEHTSPFDYKRKALCSLDDEGRCWACEQHRKDFKAKWGQRSRLYINVLVEPGGADEPFVAVLSQGRSARSITPALIEQATELGSITGKWFKIKRMGAKLDDTSYLLMPLGDVGESEPAVTDFELFDLDKVVRAVPYEEQEQHYLGTVEARQPVGVVTSGAVVNQASDDDTW